MDFYRVSSDELMHYGILGMKWGVRRYQNYDGTYTQKGLERYRKAELAYEKAKKAHKENKISGTKPISQTMNNVVIEKRALNKAAKKVKQAYKADEGKNLADQGIHIKTFGQRLVRSMGFNVISGGANFASYLMKKTAAENGNKGLAMASIPLDVVSAGAQTVKWYMIVRDWVNNARLKSYYSYKA